jgi:iron complex transport system substrate-binding protein
MRIVSLLPSATEILFDLGLGEQVVGVTFECDFPEEARQRRIVSTTSLPEGLTPAQIDAEVKSRMAAGEDLYRLDEGALRDLDPDLVLTQDLCAVCAVDITEVDAALAHLGCQAQVVTLDPMNLSQVLRSIGTVGRATGTQTRAHQIVDALQARLDRVFELVKDEPRPRLAILEWTDPPFSSGHWVPDLVGGAGAEPVLGHSGERSVQIRWADLAEARPDIIVVAPCGYRLDGARALTEALVATGSLPERIPVWAVDADAAFVRPGPRVVDGVETLAHIAHPNVAPPVAGMATLVRAGA